MESSPATAPRSLINADFPDHDALLGRDLPDRHLCLTYDDGPGLQTLAIARYLHEQGIEATFFVRGDRAEQRPNVVAETARLGHTIGNHTYSHPSLVLLDPAQVVAEIRRTHELIAPFVRPDRLLLRPPFGDWRTQTSCVADPLNDDPQLRRYAGPILWNIGGLGGNEGDRYCADWRCWEVSEQHPRALSPSSCGEGYLREIEDKGRGIILMHDNNNQDLSDDKTLQLTIWLVPRLKERGYRFVALYEVPQIAALLGVHD
jgi:peptidoglycan/xylan/chitin deacetylase (PgdA/CDA1 family)